MYYFKGSLLFIPFQPQVGSHHLAHRLLSTLRVSEIQTQTQLIELDFMHQTLVAGADPAKTQRVTLLCLLKLINLACKTGETCMVIAHVLCLGKR
jgi:hypothetical protein